VEELSVLSEDDQSSVEVVGYVDNHERTGHGTSWNG
jgi:hypothetical protein